MSQSSKTLTTILSPTIPESMPNAESQFVDQDIREALLSGCNRSLPNPWDQIPAGLPTQMMIAKYLKSLHSLLAREVGRD